MTRTLIFALGSAHGDDQLGWLVARRLAVAIPHAQVTIRRAISPTELLDILNGVDRLAICDACDLLGAPGTIHRWRWPDAPIAPFRNTGSHDFGLREVLNLAEQLAVLPPEVVVYAAEVGSSAPMASVSAAAQAAVDRLAAEIIDFIQR